MDKAQIDRALDDLEGVMDAVEKVAPQLAKVGVPFAGVAAGVADVVKLAAEKAGEVNEAFHTTDAARLQALLARARAFADEQEKLALA